MTIKTPKASTVRDWVVALTCLGILAGVFITWGSMVTKVEAMETKNSPSRDEFKALCDTVNSTNKTVGDIYNYLIKK